MDALLTSLQQFLTSGWDVIVSLLSLLLFWIPPLLVAWIVFWLFAVNWVKLRQVLLSGGWIGLILTGLVTILVWGSVAPPSWCDVTTSQGGIVSGNLTASTPNAITLVNRNDQSVTVNTGDVDRIDRFHPMLGMRLSNFVGKTVYVTTLICIMLLCGSVQLAGCCAFCCRFDDD